MCERKSWTKMEDRILKLLYEQRGYKKWSDVAQIMRTQYGILGRNGKQCRQRYHNHLDQKISKAEWTTQEDQMLLQLHSNLGNRWALIAREIKGRTDNCVKNRFYSRFRRSIRNINELIKIFWKKKFKQLKPTFISKIIQITQEYRTDKQQNKRAIFQICQDFKIRLMSFSDSTQQNLKQNEELSTKLFQLIKEINEFNRKNKRKGKKKRKQQSDYDEEQNFDSDEKLNVKNMRRKSTKSLLQSRAISQQQKFQENLSPVVKKQDIINQSEFQQGTELQDIKTPVHLNVEQKINQHIEEENAVKEYQKMIYHNRKGLEADNSNGKNHHLFEECIDDLIQDKQKEGFDVDQFYHQQNSGYQHHYFY